MFCAALTDVQEDPTTTRRAPLRACPTPPDELRSLITHSIHVSVCMSRQRDFYHKCHRCRFRGKSASFTIDNGEVATE